jgi:glycosyltransferase involved in cell wall biosynthesis
MLTSITPVILTFNEVANIERTLQRLTWAKRIVVVDSFSTDETLEILARYPQVEVYQRQFDTHATQWNYGLSLVETPWVLSLDADYCLSDELVVELATLDPNGEADGYMIPFRFCVFGKPLRGNILPPRAALFRLETATYIDDGHTQLLHCQGQMATLHSPILHDDRKSLSRWLWAQDRYALLEVDKQLKTPFQALGWSDRIRRLPGLSAPMVLVYCLIFKGGILDGWAGWHYAFQRVVAELILSMRLVEARYYSGKQ